MTDKLNIHQRMAKVMEDIDYVQKENKKVNNQYTFVSHDAVTAKVRGAFLSHGIISVPRVTSHSRDGNMTVADIEIDFINIDKPDDKITVPCFWYGIDQQDKGVGKAISYAVKYAYLKVFALETGDDPERDSIDHEPAPTIKIDKKVKSAVLDQTIACLENGDGHGLQEIFAEFSGEEKVILWGMFNSQQRTTIKELMK